jgi:hypothetical protein
MSNATTDLAVLYDRDGAQAFRMAAAICLDPARTELALELAFADAAAAHATGRRDLGTAWLMAAVYRHAIRQARLSGQCFAPFAALNESQAEVLAITLLSGLGRLQLAEHLAVPPSVVSCLLRSALRAQHPLA